MKSKSDLLSEKSGKTNACLICLVRFSNSEIKDPQALVHNPGQRGETDIYKRFLTFTKCYLKLKVLTNTFLVEAEQKENCGEVLNAFCDKCQVLVKCVCDLHEELEILKIRLSWKLKTLEVLMDNATKKISSKLAHGIFKDIAKQLKIPETRKCSLFRKALIIKCRMGAVKGVSPKVGHLPVHWPLNNNVPEEILMRLIAIFTLVAVTPVSLALVKYKSVDVGTKDSSKVDKSLDSHKIGIENENMLQPNLDEDRTKILMMQLIVVFALGMKSLTRRYKKSSYSPLLGKETVNIKRRATQTEVQTLQKKSSYFESIELEEDIIQDLFDENDDGLPEMDQMDDDILNGGEIEMLDLDQVEESSKLCKNFNQLRPKAKAQARLHVKEDRPITKRSHRRRRKVGKHRLNKKEEVVRKRKKGRPPKQKVVVFSDSDNHSAPPPAVQGSPVNANNDLEMALLAVKMEMEENDFTQEVQQGIGFDLDDIDDIDNGLPEIDNDYGDDGPPEIMEENDHNSDINASDGDSDIAEPIEPPSNPVRRSSRRVTSSKKIIEEEEENDAAYEDADYDPNEELQRKPKHRGRPKLGSHASHKRRSYYGLNWRPRQFIESRKEVVQTITDSGGGKISSEADENRNENTDKVPENDDTKGYHCDICNVKVLTNQNLLKHLIRNHEKFGKKTLQCCFCYQSFANKQTLDSHVMDERIPFHYQKFPCDAPDCFENFPTLQALNEHLSKHVNLLGEGKVKVETDTDLNTGKTEFIPNTSSPPIPIANSVKHCAKCNWGFLSEASLDVHKVSHTVPNSENDFVCKTCGEKFKCTLTLTVHYNKVHEPSVHNWKCFVCKMRFYEYKSLLGHHRMRHDPLNDEEFVIYREKKIRIVGDNEMFVCEEWNCGREFMTMIRLQKHIYNNHSGTHKCKVEGCPKAFINYAAYRKHYVKVHLKVVSNKVMCHLCGKSVKSEKIRQHMKVHEDPKIECTVCHKKIKHLENLKKHMLTHDTDRVPSFICPECGKSYHTDTGLMFHRTSVHTQDNQKRFGCPYCPKRSSRKHVMRGHVESCAKINGNGEIKEFIDFLKKEKNAKMGSA